MNPKTFFNLSDIWFSNLFKLVNTWKVLFELNSYIKKTTLKKPKEFKKYKKNVLIGKKTVIKQNVVFEGNCIIGKNCIIGPNTYLRENVLIGDNVRIGNCVEIKNSIILNNSFISHLSYIGDSIIGSEVSIGAGTILSNLRLDKKEIILRFKRKRVNTKLKKFGSIIGDNTKIGSNVVLNPGTILEKNCRVLPLKNVKGYFPKKTIIK
jgi:NDP-sugar pyrophosphorylase family protein